MLPTSTLTPPTTKTTVVTTVPPVVGSILGMVGFAILAPIVGVVVVVSMILRR